MNKNIKILIIGFGSIGQRHFNNLQKLGFKNISVYDVSRKKIRDLRLKIKEIDLKMLKKFRVVLICNPNHLHIKTALSVARAGCNFFVEKPLSHNLKGIRNLANLCQKKKLTNMVACNLRFHPCVNFIKKYLEKKKLGKIYSIDLEFGYYLPWWRPSQDYRKNYAAKKETGGGIILDDIHEFDLLFWLNDFEKVVKSKFIFDKVSNLEIKTEDICIASFEFKNKVLGQVKCDYLQKFYNRNLKIVGEKGNLEWDFNENIVWLENEKRKKKLLEVKHYDLNNMYVEEMKYFLNCLKKRKKTFNDIEKASKVLEAVLKGYAKEKR